MDTPQSVSPGWSGRVEWEDGCQNRSDIGGLKAGNIQKTKEVPSEKLPSRSVAYTTKQDSIRFSKSVLAL